MGDLNVDSNVDILDIVILLNIIIGEINPDENLVEAADINDDNVINVLDVVNLVNIVLDI